MFTLNKYNIDILGEQAPVIPKTEQYFATGGP
jgi:hypothetical protein